MTKTEKARRIHGWMVYINAREILLLDEHESGNPNPAVVAAAKEDIRAARRAIEACSW